MEIKNVKGGYDFLPSEQKIRDYITDTLKEVFIQFGYNSIETPILCYYDILVDKYDENNDIVNEIYKLTDQGCRKLGLRYDLTVPFAKCIAINKKELKMPFKRYEIAKVFRDGPVKVGRDREFTQCDVDVVGVEGQMIEAELLSLYKNAFTKLGIDIVILYNNRNLMRGLIKEAGIEDDKIDRIITIIDKIEKVSKEEFINYLINEEVKSESIDFIIKSFSMSLDELIIKFGNSNNQMLLSGLEEVKELEKYISFLGMNDICVFTPSLARGQSYYTGNVFEVYDAKKRVSGSIGGGGRYDNMITNFIKDGEKYPAVGISFGLTSIFEILKDEKRFNDKSNLDFYIIPMGTQFESLKLANDLRCLGYNVDIEMSGRKLKKSMAYANKETIPYVIVLGENEITSNSIMVKDMFNNVEIKIDLNNLELVKEIIK